MIILVALARVSAAHAEPPPAPGASTPAPEMLARIAPSIVKVTRGDGAESGFVFGTSRHVVTSYSAVEVPGTLRVVAADGSAREATVVAWSKEDDLVLLELDAPLAVPPLEAATDPPWAGEDVVVPYHPRDDSAGAGGSTVPIAQFGHVGRIVGAKIDLDLNLWGRTGDLGAPVVTPAGRVLGVVVRDARNRSVAVVTGRARALFDGRGRQGSFTRHYPTTGFVGLFVTPTTSDGFVGAGLDSGLRHDWLLVEITESAFRSGYRPVADGVFTSVERFQFEMDVEAQLALGQFIRLSAGPGLQIRGDTTTTRVVSTSAVSESKDDHASVRLAGSLALQTYTFLLRVNVSDEVRLDLGILFGR